MGRLATTVAAALVDADNMPNPPPNVSILDALLPRRVVSALVGPTKSKDEEVKNKLRRVSNSPTSSLATSAVALAPTPTHKPARKVECYRRSHGKFENKQEAQGSATKTPANATPEQRSTNTSKTKVRYWDISPTKRGFVARKATSPEKKEANVALDAKKDARNASPLRDDKKVADAKADKPASVMNFGGGGTFGGNTFGGGWGGAYGGGTFGGLGGGGGGGGWEQVGAGTWNKPTSDKAKADDKKTPAAAGLGGLAGALAAGAEKSKDDAWTAEEDAKLRELKAANKTWKEIAEAIPGRPQWQLKARFNEIGKDGPTAAGGATAGGAAAIRGGGSDKLAGAGVKRDEDRKGSVKATSPYMKIGGFGVHDKKDDEGTGGKKLTKKEKKAQKAAGGGRDDNNDDKAFATKPAPAETATAEIRIMDEDDMFSFDELTCLVEILDAEPEASWNRLAARFYNKTGRRVQSDDVRDKLEFWCGV